MKNCLLSNMSLNPEATSTPNVVPRIGRRKGIRDLDGGCNSTQSPIAPDTDQHNYCESRPYELNTSPKSVRREIILNRSKSFDDLRTEIENHNETDDEEDNKKIKDNEKYDNQDKHFNLEYIKKFKTCVIYTCVTVIFVFLAFLRHSTVVNHHSVEVENKPKEVVNICNSQKELFQTQDQDFCLNIEVSLKDIIHYDKTKTLILVYDQEREMVVDKIINKIAPSILCSIRDCNRESVVIQGASLNLPRYTNDYGRILSDYKDSLEKNGLLIVHNIEKISGKSIRAFHYICDEYNPFVNKAFIILTMKMEKTPYINQKSIIRNRLLQLWSDIGKDDVFDPLISRIAGTILSVK